MHKRLGSSILGLVFAFACVAAWAGPGAWTTSGPHGGSAPSISQHPTNASILYASGGGGVFKSLDGGANWSRIEVGLPQTASAIAIAAAQGDVVYVALDRFGANRVFRSNDAGATWSVTALTPGPTEYVFAISVRPGSNDDVAVAVDSGVYVTHDGGLTWTGPGTASGLPTGSNVSLQSVHYGQTTIYTGLLQQVASDPTKLVYKSTDGGASWTATADLLLPTGQSLTAVQGVTVLRTAPADDLAVYAVDGNGFGAAVSTNGGASWSNFPIPAGCPTNGFGAPRTITIDPADSQSLWLGCRDGLFHSTNGGAAWTPMSTGLSANGTGNAIAVETVVLDRDFATSNTMWVGSLYGGLYRSSNGGSTWTESIAGLESTNVRALGVHPNNAELIYSGYGDVLLGTSATLWRSVDGGGSWQVANTGLNAEQIRSITIDPTSPPTLAGTIVYAAGRSDPVPAFANKDGGIYKSTNGGDTWSTIDTGIALVPPTGPASRPDMGTVRTVVLDPTSCVPKVLPCTTPLQTVFVGGSGRAGAPPVGNPYRSARIYKSIDAGAQWLPSETGLPLPQDIDPGPSITTATVNVIPIVIDPVTPSTMYLGTFVSFPGGEFVPTVQNGVFKSVDSGATWSHSSTGIASYPGVGSSNLDVFTLALVPTNPGVIYAGAAISNLFTPGAQQGRIFKSTDGAATWAEFSNGIAGSDIRALYVDPSDATGNTVYAGSAGVGSTNPGGVFKTTDGGVTWNSISVGLPADAATSFARDPSDPSRIYAGTVAGTWSLSQLADADVDSASTLTESTGPNGSSADADGDTVPDRLDPDTATLPLATPPTLARGDGGAPLPSYVSIVVKPAAAVGCNQVNNAQTIGLGRLPPDPQGGTDHERNGVVRFELPRCSNAIVDITFFGQDFSAAGWTWRNYGPSAPGDDASIGWYAFANAAKLDTDTWRLTLDADAQGNFRSDSDTILFQGGPTFVQAAVYSDGFE